MTLSTAVITASSLHDRRLSAIVYLSQDAIQRGRATLRPADVVIRPRRVPEHVERPTLWAVCEEAPQCEANFDRVDLSLVGARGSCTQDVEGQVDDDPLVP
ncbi:hypothetical protein Q5H91_07405 [Sphingomonas sp. KR1UV-12]|uniref:Uncharacterized protein n=1 Tax=Sphingomonas aurea TaxID=3063994 RepID=A0ABT9EJ98_9SPHN|nr:hypothetical protein [Sphingomonas sp. KR1UV-12]MDP1027033.1 hypothetical protein [Sphingomonas sp. KR1UV-12]